MDSRQLCSNSIYYIVLTMRLLRKCCEIIRKFGLIKKSWIGFSILQQASPMVWNFAKLMHIEHKICSEVGKALK